MSNGNVFYLVGTPVPTSGEDETFPESPNFEPHILPIVGWQTQHQPEDCLISRYLSYRLAIPITIEPLFEQHLYGIMSPDGTITVPEYGTYRDKNDFYNAIAESETRTNNTLTVATVYPGKEMVSEIGFYIRPLWHLLKTDESSDILKNEMLSQLPELPKMWSWSFRFGENKLIASSNNGSLIYRKEASNLQDALAEKIAAIDIDAWRLAV